jgi:hypothetical protein
MAFGYEDPFVMERNPDGMNDFPPAMRGTRPTDKTAIKTKTD